LEDVFKHPHFKNPLGYKLQQPSEGLKTSERNEPKMEEKIINLVIHEIGLVKTLANGKNILAAIVKLMKECK